MVRYHISRERPRGGHHAYNSPYFNNRSIKYFVNISVNYMKNSNKTKMRSYCTLFSPDKKVLNLLSVSAKILIENFSWPLSNMNGKNKLEKNYLFDAWEIQSFSPKHLLLFLWKKQQLLMTNKSGVWLKHHLIFSASKLWSFFFVRKHFFYRSVFLGHHFDKIV